MENRILLQKEPEKYNCEQTEKLQKINKTALTFGDKKVTI